MTELDKILERFMFSFTHLDDPMDLRQTSKAIENLFAVREIEAYKKGHIDGSIEVIDGTCDICHSYPMTANCNNAGCDK